VKNALLSAFGSMFFAAARGRVLLALLLAYFALALPPVLLFAEAVRSYANHRAEPIAFADALDFTAWFDLRKALRPAEGALAFSALAAFLLGICSAGGWLEVLSNRLGRPGFKVFAAGAGGRFIRYLRLAVLSRLAIAGARYLCYGAPADALQRFLSGGSGELVDFPTESAANHFQWWRSIAFAACVAWVVLVSDLGRAALVVRGGRSAIVAGFRGLVLFFRNPFSSVAAIGLPFAVEFLLLWGVAWWVERLSDGEANDLNLALLFLATQCAVIVREVCRAGRLGALLAIAEADDDARFERRYGKQGDPILAAAGGAMTEEYEG
jgi:hypothetical protein